VRRLPVVLVLAGTFLLWNAIYDHVLIVAGDLYIVVARVTASHGVEALIALAALGAAASLALLRRLLRK
jgi:hypothetical protein